MSSPSAEEVIDAFADAVRDELKNGNDVEVPFLGTFVVEHRSSEVKEVDGKRRLLPPRNVVVFNPEQS